MALCRVICKRTEKDCRTWRRFHFHVPVIRKMSLTIGEFIIQIDEQSSYPLTTFHFKFSTRCGIVAARVVMSLVIGAWFVANNLEIFAAPHMSAC